MPTHWVSTVGRIRSSLKLLLHPSNEPSLKIFVQEASDDEEQRVSSRPDPEPDNASKPKKKKKKKKKEKEKEKEREKQREKDKKHKKKGW